LEPVAAVDGMGVAAQGVGECGDRVPPLFAGYGPAGFDGLRARCWRP